MRLAIVLCSLVACAAADDFRGSFPQSERPWPGPEYWSNPLQDWRVIDGRLEAIVSGGDRNVFLLTREVSSKPGTLAMSVRLGRLESDTEAMSAGFAGFRFGIRGAFADYRDSALRGVGVNAGLAVDGRLFIGRLDDSAPKVARVFDQVDLRLAAQPSGSGYTVTLQAFDRRGGKLGEVSRSDIAPSWIAGGVALVCSSAEVVETPPASAQPLEAGWGGRPGTQRGGTVRFWFRDWKVSGTKVEARPERTFGPVLFAMHTLHRKVLKLTAQMAPAGSAAGQVRLQTKASAQAPWKTVATAAPDPMARTATFRIPNWDDSRDTPYRVACDFDGREHSFEGTVRKDPVAKPRIVAAAFTGNNDFGFPHADVVRHVSHFRPDLLVFTGDQIYEGVGGYGYVRTPLEAATLDYLRKWFLFGWEYGELLRHTPAVCLPDDHDVYQGNLFGVGGRAARGTDNAAVDLGGYVMPPEWVNMIQRTQTSHMPDPFDPAPVEQGISVYYCPLLVGGVSFAVIEDRKWKSGPGSSLPRAGIRNGMALNAGFDPVRESDVAGAEMLGPRQIEFLNKWAADWSGGAWVKSVISQTLFAGVSTFPRKPPADGSRFKLWVMKAGEYPPDEAPAADHDTNGWPQTGRNDALRAMRRGLAFHIAGDQHLGSTVHYGIEDFGDAGWAVCVPSVANIYPRRWYPSEPGGNRRPGAPRYTGDFLDGFGNKVTVAAVSNPIEVDAEPRQIHRRAPGYGIVSFDRATRKITVANWPRWVDPSKPGAKPYEGWPITIDQLDNGLPRKGWVLPAISFGSARNPVVQVADEQTGEIVYTVRAAGASFTPTVFRDGVYTVTAFDPDGTYRQVLRGQRARR